MNAVGTAVVGMLRAKYLNVMDDWMNEVFQDKEGTRPPLKDLEARAALGFHYGHPLILEGSRPMTSNMISIGMMNCQPVKPIQNIELESFLNSKAAKEHGVILISFGSLIKADAVGKFFLRKWALFVHFPKKLCPINSAL